jgi:hypothetical protein
MGGHRRNELSSASRTGKEINHSVGRNKRSAVPAKSLFYRNCAALVPAYLCRAHHFCCWRSSCTLQRVLPTTAHAMNPFGTLNGLPKRFVYVVTAAANPKGDSIFLRARAYCGVATRARPSNWVIPIPVCCCGESSKDRCHPSATANRCLNSTLTNCAAGYNSGHLGPQRGQFLIRTQRM